MGAGRRHPVRRARRREEQGEARPTRPGLVIRQHGQTAVVEDDQGHEIECSARKRVGRVVCGDRVRWQPTAPGQGVILAIEPRHGVLTRPDPRGRARPLAANLDQALIVCAPEPPLSEALIDRYLVVTELMDIDAALVINKTDLLDDATRDALGGRLAVYARIGYELLWVNSRERGALAPLVERLRDRTSILVGQSGVGKSSLVRALLPEADIRVGAVSDATGLGRHTTTDTRLYHLPDGGDIIDSPGVRDFHLWHIAPEDLHRGYREFRPLLGQCRFHNCRHISEPGCAVAAAADRGEIDPERLARYRALYRQLGEAARPDY